MMEDKLSSKVSHVWTLSDFIERRKNWDQGDEARLAEYLQQLSNKISQGAKSTLNELEDLVASIDNTAIQVANVNNEFQLLADKQFIENKVQEEDETVQIKVEKPVIHEINDADVLVNNIREALKNSFKAVDNHFEKITVVVSDSDDDELKHEETILRPKLFYKKLNLPSLSGNIHSESPIDNTLSSDSDVEPPMDTFKKQESFSSDDVPEENVHYINESKSTDEANHQTVDNYNNIIEPVKFKPKNISSDTVYVENDLFSPPPLINDNDEDDLVNEYNIFSGNMFGERNLWDDPDDDGDSDFEPPLPIYTDEPPLQAFKSSTQEKVPSIQQTLNDELRNRFQKNNVSSLSDNENIESPTLKLPAGAVNVLSGTDLKSAAQSSAQNTKQATVTQISKNVAEPILYNTVSNVRKDIITSNKLFGDSSQNLETLTNANLKEEIKTIKKQSLFEQESDDEDLFAEKMPNVIPVSNTDEPKQKENLVKNVKESNTIFPESDEEFMDSKSTTKEILSHSVDNKSTSLLDSSSDDDLFNIKSSSNKSILKQKSDQVKHKSQSHIEEKNNKEIINEPKNNPIEPSVIADNKIIEKESIRNNNTLNVNMVSSSMDNNPKKLSYLFSSDEDDDIFFDIVDDTNKNRNKKDQSISNSTKSAKNRNEKRYGLKVELFDSSSDDEIFNTNKSNNNFNSKKNDKLSRSNEDKNKNNLKLLDDHNTINQIQEVENIDEKNVIDKKLMDKKHRNVFSLESDDDINDDYLTNNANISDKSKMLSYAQNTNHNMNSMSLSSEEYFTPISEPQYNVFNNFPVENILNSKNHKSFNEKELDTSQNETFPSYIGNNIEDSTSIFSSSDDEQQSPFNSTIHDVNPSSEINAMQSNLDSLSENLPIINNKKLLNEKEINASKNETSPISSKNIIQVKKSLISLCCDDKQQLSFNSNIEIKESGTEIKLISPTLDSLPTSSPIPKNLESLNEKETAKNKTSSSSIENKILDSKSSSIFSSNEDEQKSSFNSNIQNEMSNSTNKVIWPTPDSKTPLKDLTDGSSFSSLNQKKEEPKKIPGKLNINAGAFINVASLLPHSKNPIIKPKISQITTSDEKITDTLPTSGTKLYSAEKERARIQVKRRPPSRKARQLAISQISSIYIDHDQESNLEDSSRLNVSTSLEKDYVDYKASPILQEDNLEVQNKNQTQSNSKLFSTNDDKINAKKEIKNEVKKKSTFDLFDEDSDPFETMIDDKNSKDFTDNNTKNKIGEKQMESKLLIDPHSDFVENEKQLEIESENKKLPKSKSKHDKLVKELHVEGIEGNNHKLSFQSTILPSKSNSLFDDEEDLFSVKSKKVTKPSSNIFDSDDEFEFNHKFTKKNAVITKSIFGDDSDDDLFSTPSKSATSNLSNQKLISNLNQCQNRSSTDGYVKLTAESVAVNPLDESKNN